MTRFRALPMVVLTLSALVAGTAAGQTSKSAKARMARAARGNLFSIGGVLNANRVRCALDNIGDVCSPNIFVTSESEDGIWPSTTNDTYIFNSGIQLAGLIPPGAGFAWAGDTVGAFFRDFRGDQVDGSPLGDVFDSRDSRDTPRWPASALIRDPAIFAAPLLGRPSASDQDLWTRYWDGSPVQRPGRVHPMGIAVDQRAMEFTGPGYNQDIMYLVYTITNVSASDPAAYNGIDPSIRGDYIALGRQFRQSNDSAFGVMIPTGGYRIDSVFFAEAMDEDITVNNVANNNSTLSIPFATSIAYASFFKEPLWAFPADVFGQSGLAPVPGLLGVAFLRYPVDSLGRQVGIRVWTGIGGGGTYREPVGVGQLYRYVSGTSSPGAGDGSCSVPSGRQLALKYCLAVTSPQEDKFIFSTGPVSLAPGQQQTVVLAYLFAGARDTVAPYIGTAVSPGFPTLGDSIAADTTKVRLIERIAGWVTQSDVNADGVIEENEVTTWPGSLLNKVQFAQAFVNTKFLTPQPPAAPHFFVIPGDRNVTVVWEKSASEGTGDPFYAVASDPTSAVYDPNFRDFDVEGYRIYRGLTPNNLQLVAQFDYTGTEMEDYLGDFDYGSQCAPELGITTGCPVAFPATPDPAIREPHPLVGLVIQVPPGGRTATPNGLAVIGASDTAVTGHGSGFPQLEDTGIPFSWVDSSVVAGVPLHNSFQYYYAVTAFSVNSLRSGPSSLESPLLVRSVTPRTGTRIGQGSLGPVQVLDRSGAVLTGATPTLDPATGEFSGPAAPANGLSLSMVSFLPELLDSGSITVRLDSVTPGFNGIDFTSRSPATYYLSAVNSGGDQSHAVISFIQNPDNFPASATAPITGARVSSTKGALYGADTAFALVMQAVASSPGAWDLTSPGRASTNGAPANSALTGDRWWSGSVNENVPGPTDSLCAPASGSCARTTAQLAHTGGAITGVTVIAPIQGYSTVRSVPQRDIETLTATVYRAADFNVYWGSGGVVDSVIDVTHDAPVPFDSRIRASWGILDSTSFVGITDDVDGNANVLSWSDVACVDPVNGYVAALANGCANPAPLKNTAHLSTTAIATGTFGSVPASQGPGFIFYLAGKFWLVSMPALPSAGTVWHARYIAGHIIGARPNLTFAPAAVTPAAVPGLRIRVPYVGTALDLTHTTDSMLARIHTVPDPFYVTNALGTAADSQHIEFVHLPPEAIVRIYSVAGRLVAHLTHQDQTGGGQLDWNVKSRDGKTVASGVYFYVVETADHRTKVGRFTVVTYSP